MVKLACECMLKLSPLVNELSQKFGKDTRMLQMRVGLHSGPTTAGVLQGEKSCFQLFGDTVNTALRMESNGVPGHIHVSQAMADQLIAKGKGSWLIPREDKVIAKGKGEMQTYFVTTTFAVRTTSSGIVTASIGSSDNADGNDAVVLGEICTHDDDGEDLD